MIFKSHGRLQVGSVIHVHRLPYLSLTQSDLFLYVSDIRTGTSKMVQLGKGACWKSLTA